MSIVLPSSLGDPLSSISPVQNVNNYDPNDSKLKAAKEFWENGDIRNALFTARKVPDHFKIDVIKKHVENGQIVEAQKIVKLLTDDSKKIEFFKECLESAAMKAIREEVAKLLTDDSKLEISEESLKNGQFEKAAWIAGLLTDDSKLKIARNFFDNGHIKTGQWLVERLTENFKVEVVKKFLGNDRIEEVEVQWMIYSTTGDCRMEIIKEHLKQGKVEKAKSIFISSNDFSIQFKLLQQTYRNYIKKGDLAVAESMISLIPIYCIRNDVIFNRNSEDILTLSKEYFLKEGLSKAILVTWKLSAESFANRLLSGSLLVVKLLGICAYHWTHLVIAKAKKSVQNISLFAQKAFN